MRLAVLIRHRSVARAVAARQRCSVTAKGPGSVLQLSAACPSGAAGFSIFPLVVRPSRASDGARAILALLPRTTHSPARAIGRSPNTSKNREQYSNEVRMVRPRSFQLRLPVEKPQRLARPRNRPLRAISGAFYGGGRAASTAPWVLLYPYLFFLVSLSGTISLNTGRSGVVSGSTQK